MKDTLRDIYDAVDEFFGGLGSRRITTYSAACAYYLFMSLVPVIMLLVSVLQYTPLTRDVVLGAVAEYVPESLYEIVDFIVSSIYNGGRVALTVSILLTLWSASACMKALLRGMDSVYDAERREDYIRFSIRACVYMVIFVVLLLLSFFVMVYGGRILDFIEQSMPVNHSLDFLFTVAKYLRFVIILALLALVYAAGAMAAMYITYTPVGMVRIVGLQARYFLCVWLALLPALAVLLRKTIRPAITEEKVEAAITPLCACYAVFGAVLLFQHYFVGPVYVVYA